MKVQPLKTAAKWLPSPASPSRPRASTPDITSLLEVFDEPIRDANGPASIAAEPAFTAPSQHLIRPQANSPAPKPAPAAATTKPAVPVKGLITALVGIAIVPMAILFVLLWQDTMRPRVGHEAPPIEKSAARLTPSMAPVRPEQAPSPLEVALTSPDLIQADGGAAVDFPIAIDATGALPARSIVTVAALPDGASFSAGRPYGVNGWSLRPDEIGDLRLRLPALTGASALRLELVAGDGTVLAQSETKVSTAPTLEIATVASVDNAPPDAIVSNPFEQVAAAETTALIESDPADAIAKVRSAELVADAPPPPDRKPRKTAATDSGVKVNTVKVVTIKPPQQARAHDGAYALGSPADEPSAEWMETKTAVDMHAKAEQTSETVKVAEGGVRVRVMARDKNWVQVSDPKSSTTGWIYNRFLKPIDPPAQ